MGTFCFLLALILVIDKINALVNDRYYPRYHLAPPSGWMNDPNGFSFFKNEYHLFYQHDPNNSLAPALIHWGHAKSKDLVHWEHLPIALSPDKPYDRSGVFSGSALIENGKMYLFYSGQVSKPGETPDHEESQALAISTDGITMHKYKYNPVLKTPEHQPDIRDPKVWKHNGKYYMVLGNSFTDKGNTLGRILLYQSEDKLNWKQVSILGESNGTLGYMWECPDFFPMGPYYVLLFSPQGVAPVGDNFRNLYQSGYIVGKFSYLTHEFRPITEFQELDHGHDFYATQTVLDNFGRRIVVAWFDMWDNGYPEGPDGFTGQMTLPRSLTLTRDLRLLQKPVSVRGARGRILRTGRAVGGSCNILPDKAGKVTVLAPASRNLELIILGGNITTIFYDAQNGQISLDRGGNDNLRRTEWKPYFRALLNVYIDASSIEVFCGRGEVTFSSRFFPDGPVGVCLDVDSDADLFEVTELRRSINHD